MHLKMIHLYFYIIEEIYHHNKCLEVCLPDQTVKAYAVSTDIDNFCSIDIVQTNIPTSNV